MMKWHTEKVLDHGYVAYIDSMGSDESIVEAARMSTDKGFISWEPYVRCKKCGTLWRWFKNHPEPTLKGTYSLFPDQEEKPGSCCDAAPMETTDMERFPNGDIGLMDTLWRKKHATPFEMGELCIEVQAPIVVFREWMRHRTQSYNEFSARYSVMPSLHYVPALDRLKPKNSDNKQETSATWPIEGDTNFEAFLGGIAEQQDYVYGRYEEMLEVGVPKETARINTPVSRYSKMRAKGNLRNWFQFLNLRMRPDAQWEIRQYAESVARIIKALWPKAYELFEEYDLYGCYLSRTELRILKAYFGETALVHNKEYLNSHGLTGRKATEFIEKMRSGGERILG